MTTTVPTAYSRVFDHNNPNWHKSEVGVTNDLFVKCQLDWASDKLRARGHIFLNEIYDMLSVPRSSAGQLVGWLASNNRKIKFDITKREDGSMLIDFNTDGVIYDKID